MNYLLLIIKKKVMFKFILYGLMAVSASVLVFFIITGLHFIYKEKQKMKEQLEEDAKTKKQP